jgi:hypothetical protein
MRHEVKYRPLYDPKFVLETLFVVNIAIQGNINCNFMQSDIFDKFITLQ